ncbi:MAG: hypothetical protein ACYC27_16990 [Armatimonadota bacterium]
MQTEANNHKVKIDTVSFFNQPNCYMLSNGKVEVIVTTDIGPRIIGYRYKGGQNILAELGPDTSVKTEYGVWHPWGGHRLWHAPESAPRSYMPDDSPVSIEIIGDNSIRLVQSVEQGTGIEKEMLLKLDADGTRVTILHKLTNRGLWPVKLAPWALTIVKGGGETIIPNEPYISHDDEFLPARPLVLWYFTDMSDPRWTFGKNFLRLRTDEDLDEPQKVGAANKQGWAGYLNDGTLFVKRFPYVPDATYADYGCNCETYTAGSFMEVESLGPLTVLETDQSTIHIEQWFLFDGVQIGDGSESELQSAIMPLVESTITE